MAGHDVVAMARTGSGKTAAFLLPMLHKLVQHETTIGVRAVVLSPTRELALQTADVVRALMQFTDLRACVLVGGERIESQFSDLSANPDIIIATPGRLMQMLIETDMSLREVRFVVFDECDRLFEMGFAEQINQMLTRLPESRQMALFSATLPTEMVSFARAGLRAPQLVRLDADVRVSENLSLAFLVCRPAEKVSALLWLLQTQLNPQTQQTIVFASTRYIVEYLSNLLCECGFDAAYVYGTMDAAARKINLARFRNGKLRILCVTDLAARGIDVPLLDYVVNYDVAARPKTFVHRVGRVARAGRSGAAFSIVGTDDLAMMVDLYAFLGHQLKQLPLRANTPEAAQYRLQPGAVHYGLLPQISLQSNFEIVQEAHKRQPELLRILRASENANKLVLKTRPAASRSSIKRSKLLQVTELHPLCFMHGAAPDVVLEMDRASLLSSMRNFRPRATVFELSGDKASVVNVMMQQKRNSHQSVITAVRSQAIERANGDDDDEVIRDSLSAPTRNTATDDDNDYDEDDDEDDDNDDNERAVDDDDDDDNGGGDFWNANDDDDDDGADEDLLADDFDLDEADNDVQPTRVSRKADEGAGGAAATTTAAAAAAAGKSRMSKHERRLLRRAAAGKADGAGQPALAGRKRNQSDALSSSQYRDPAFFMSYTQSGASASKAYAIDAENEPKPLVKGAVPLDSISLEGGETLAAEDEKGLQRKKFVRKWDRARKRYVNVAPGIDPNDNSQAGRKMKLDNGQTVDATPTGAYEQWQKKSHKRIGRTGESERELVDLGEIETPASKSGLTMMRGRVVTGRLRSSLVPTAIGGDGNEYKVGAPEALLKKVAQKGGELGSADAIAKEKKEKTFKQMVAKHGLNKARQLTLKEKLQKRAEIKQKRHSKNRSTKKGYGATTMKEFKMKFKRGGR
jgi:superfamily II DNA/RNA helicase